MIQFSDLTLTLILPICFGVLIFLPTRFMPSPTYRFLTESQFIEFLWTFLPALSLLLLAAPSLSLLYLLDEVGFPSSTSIVQGHQWYWHYETSDISPTLFDSYMVSGPLNRLSTDTSLIVSRALNVRFLVTAADVLHSWSVPAFGLKADCVPGRLNSLSTYLERAGVFYGQCSEICGSNHSFMPISVEVHA